VAECRDRAEARLVAVGGWMGAGKSTVARRLAQALGAELLEADALRGDLAEAGFARALAPDFTPDLYRVLLERARSLLAAGRSVVVDGCFASRAERARARRLAAESGARFAFAECRAPEAVCRDRLRGREAAGEPGWLELFQALLARWEPVDELPGDAHHVVDSAGPEPRLDAVLDALAGVRTLPPRCATRP
jgi:predicted kinase